MTGSWTKAYHSWGRLLRVRHRAHRAGWLADATAALRDDPGPVLAYGRGRSYGDSCLNADGEREIARYDLSEDSSTETAMIFGELYRYGNEWKFRAVGQGYNGGLGPLARSFGVNV